MIFSISNQKGGVGKTTIVINLSYELSILGKKILVIDLDPQSNTTSGFGYKLQDSDSIDTYKLLINDNSIKYSDIEKQNIHNKNLHLIPATIDLAGAEVELVSALSRETILKRKVNEISKNFDYIFIDCPPSLGLLTINSLVCSDYVIIPVQAEYFALEGLGLLVETIDLIKSNLNPTLEVGGVLLTMYDQRTNLSKEIYKEINTYFDKKLFSTIVPRNIKLSEAPSHGLPISKYSQYSTGSLAFKNLASEFIKRFDNIDLVNPLIKKYE